MSDADVADKAAWRQSQAEARRAHQDSALAATPAQRLAWLEEALQIAHQSGALANARAADEGSAAEGEGVEHPHAN